MLLRIIFSVLLVLAPAMGQVAFESSAVTSGAQVNITYIFGDLLFS